MTGIDWQAFARIFDDFNTEEYSPVPGAFYPWIVDRQGAPGAPTHDVCVEKR